LRRRLLLSVAVAMAVTEGIDVRVWRRCVLETRIDNGAIRVRHVGGEESVCRRGNLPDFLKRESGKITTGQQRRTSTELAQEQDRWETTRLIARNRSGVSTNSLTVL